MPQNFIHAQICEAVRDAAAVNGTDVTVEGSTRPAADVEGIDSMELIHVTGELAHRLGIEVPLGENIFLTPDGKRARSVDEVSARLTELASVFHKVVAIAP